MNWENGLRTRSGTRLARLKFTFHNSDVTAMYVRSSQLDLAPSDMMIIDDIAILSYDTEKAARLGNPVADLPLTEHASVNIRSQNNCTTMENTNKTGSWGSFPVTAL